MGQDAGPGDHLADVSPGERHLGLPDQDAGPVLAAPSCAVADVVHVGVRHHHRRHVRDPPADPGQRCLQPGQVLRVTRIHHRYRFPLGNQDRVRVRRRDKEYPVRDWPARAAGQSGCSWQPPLFSCPFTPTVEPPRGDRLGPEDLIYGPVVEQRDVAAARKDPEEQSAKPDGARSHQARSVCPPGTGGPQGCRDQSTCPETRTVQNRNICVQVPRCGARAPATPMRQAVRVTGDRQSTVAGRPPGPAKDVISGIAGHGGYRQ